LEIYIVKKGDTLYRIAAEIGVSMETLIEENQLQNPDVLSVGQALLIGGSEDGYVVRPGDTLYSIARRHGISLSALVEANPQIRDPARIQPGDRLHLPGNGRKIIVNGYASVVTDAALRGWLPGLTFLSPFSFQVDAEGGWTPSFDVNTAIAGSAGVKSLLTVTNLRPQGGFSGEIAHALFTNEAARARLFHEILSTLADQEYYGVNLDFEYLPKGDREEYNCFVRALSDTLHESGYILATALAPKLSDDQPGTLYQAHDYGFHGQAADYVVLMTYEWGYTYGPPMAVAPLNMVRRVLDYAVSAMPSSKILMGIPNYGYDWKLPYVQGSAAKPITNVRAVTLAGQVRSSIKFDLTAQSPYFRYIDKDGARHEVWFEDARSLQAKLGLVREYDLAGVSIWNLNNLWRTAVQGAESMYNVEKRE